MPFRIPLGKVKSRDASQIQRLLFSVVLSFSLMSCGLMGGNSEVGEAVISDPTNQTVLVQMQPNV